MTGVEPSLTLVVSTSEVMGANAVVKPGWFDGSNEASARTSAGMAVRPESSGWGAETGWACVGWEFITGMFMEGTLEATLASGWGAGTAG